MGFGYDVSLMASWFAQLAQQLSLGCYIYNVACEVGLWVLGMMLL